MRYPLRALTLSLCTATLAACGGDGTGPSGDDTLTSAEANAVAKLMLVEAAGHANGSGGPAASLAPLAAMTTFTLQVDRTESCAPSGVVRVRGSVTTGNDPETDAGMLQATLAIAHTLCGYATPQGVITVSGLPDLDATVNATSNASGITSFVITETGAFTWTRGSASGNCTVDMRAERNASGQMLVSGTACGFALSGTVVLG